MRSPSQRGGIALAVAAVFALLAGLHANPARDIAEPEAASGAQAIAAPAVRPPDASAVRPDPTTDPDLARAQQRSHPAGRSEPIKDLFAPRPWAGREVPPPSEPPVTVQAKPEAPLLPYKYLGQLSEQGRTVVFLARDELPVMGRVGEVLDGAYRIERISAAEVELTYLPLDTRQVLAAGPVQ